MPSSMLRERRRTLGPCASAALPPIWKGLAKNGWTHADLARALGVSSAAVAGLLYGIHGASRRTATDCQRIFGVRLELWDKPCPPNWRPHSYVALQAKKRGHPEAS